MDMERVNECNEKRMRKEIIVIINGDEIFCDWWDEKLAEILREISVDISGCELLNNPYCG